ncbi:MAG: ankyrin repeat domain-containing protein [Verrucomicrobia bacterium]|nr:ankyrin repeat domain-containing protein [Verrucomicrobiota bacterium]
MKKRLQWFAFLVVLTCSNPGCSLFIPSHHDILDYKPIHAAAESGDLATVKGLLEKNPKLIGAKDWGNLTPLHLAVVHNHKDVAEFLLEHGANVNARTSTGITPLHEAAQNGNLEIVKLLLTYKANIRALDNQGWTPFDRAIKWRHPDVAEYLWQHGGQSQPQQLYAPKWLAPQ